VANKRYFRKKQKNAIVNSKMSYHIQCIITVLFKALPLVSVFNFLHTTCWFCTYTQTTRLTPIFYLKIKIHFRVVDKFRLLRITLEKYSKSHIFMMMQIQIFLHSDYYTLLIVLWYWYWSITLVAIFKLKIKKIKNNLEFLHLLHKFGCVLLIWSFWIWQVLD
jgi:hypothetical protein